jgi:hypothetical protein
MKIVKVYNDDWCALYINGKEVQQGHSINFYDLMKTFKQMGVIESFDSFEAHTESDYPENFTDVNIIE